MNPDKYTLTFKGQKITTVTMFKVGDQHIAAPSITQAVEQYLVDNQDAGDYGALTVRNGEFKWRVIYSPDGLEIISTS